MFSGTTADSIDAVGGEACVLTELPTNEQLGRPVIRALQMTATDVETKWDRGGERERGMREGETEVQREREDITERYRSKGLAAWLAAMCKLLFAGSNALGTAEPIHHFEQPHTGKGCALLGTLFVRSDYPWTTLANMAIAMLARVVQG
jgi:hypothetical protein